MVQVNTTEEAVHRIAVFGAAQDGQLYTLFKLLDELPNLEERNKAINTISDFDDGRSLTPFAAAALNGRVNIVKLLLEKFEPTLDIECTTRFEGTLVFGVTALWCAASRGHLDVVKLLVRKGSKVNHLTRNDSTPLRAACFTGRLDIVQYLIAHGADLNLSNKFNNNCLMIASYKGYLDVVEYLLKNGVNVNQQANCGATALHYAAEVGNTDVCAILLDNGAELLPNEFGFSAITMAAERVREEVVQMFMARQGLMDKRSKIDALELMGASFANDKDHYSLAKAHYYLTCAMELRFSDPEDVVTKEVLAPIPAYGDWVESQTMEELQAIRLNHNSLHMESLTIRERILGANFPDLIHPIIFRGAVCADNGRFDRCENLWLHALQLRQINGLPIQKDLLRFAQLFAQVYHVNYKFNMLNMITVLRCCIEELNANESLLVGGGGADTDNELAEEFESNVVTGLYLITIVTKILKRDPSLVTTDELREIQDIVTVFVAMNPKLRNGQTLLHLALNAQTPVDDFHTNDVCQFPSLDLAQLLLCCNGRLDEVDLKFNTPLHTLLANECYSKLPLESRLATVEDIVKLCIRFGSHLDEVNGCGQSIVDLAESDDMKCLVRQYQSTAISLKCLASKVIVTHRIPYDSVPFLAKFIKLHDPHKV